MNPVETDPNDSFAHPVRSLARQLQELHDGILFFADQMQDVLNWQRRQRSDFLGLMEDELPDPLRQEWRTHRGKLEDRQKSLVDQLGLALSTSEGISQHLSWGMNEKAGKYEAGLRCNLREVLERLCKIGVSGRIPWKDFNLTLRDFDRQVGAYAIPVRDASVTLETVALRPLECASSLSDTNATRKQSSTKPLTDKAAAVLELLKALPANRGMKGPEILDALNKRTPPMNFDQSTLTKRIIPALRPYGVKNRRGAGYYIDESSLRDGTTSTPS